MPDKIHWPEDDEQDTRTPQPVADHVVADELSQLRSTTEGVQEDIRDIRIGLEKFLAKPDTRKPVVDFHDDVADKLDRLRETTEDMRLDIESVKAQVEDPIRFTLDKIALNLDGTNLTLSGILSTLSMMFFLFFLVIVIGIVAMLGTLRHWF